jgi:hypothetical protein
MTYPEDDSGNFPPSAALYYLAVFLIGVLMASCAPEVVMDFVSGGRW